MYTCLEVRSAVVLVSEWPCLLKCILSVIVLLVQVVSASQYLPSQCLKTQNPLGRDDPRKGMLIWGCRVSHDLSVTRAKTLPDIQAWKVFQSFNYTKNIHVELICSPSDPLT